MSSWKLIEDVTLCECWVHTTHDPITGNEMDKREMWSKITKSFNDVHGRDVHGKDLKTQRRRHCNNSRFENDKEEF